MAARRDHRRSLRCGRHSWRHHLSPPAANGQAAGCRVRDGDRVGVGSTDRRSASTGTGIGTKGLDMSVASVCIDTVALASVSIDVSVDFPPLATVSLPMHAQRSSRLCSNLRCPSSSSPSRRRPLRRTTTRSLLRRDAHVLHTLYFKRPRAMTSSSRPAFPRVLELPSP